ncbi:hypothetical protein PtrV1_07449 [Pyrenophora tritici-repentis]|uniref:Uncharacterized protein n=1 Tax=Pyrenophora tritici-repentis TaxID=45151 RepID=A0A2W1FA68_9PLEO|nr:hypothetical protein PtrV1_07449 [Pyrenophora tritici-repentis]KAF7448512.1 hypothetical protein A1F99_078760 [Pyrenophora tritici-repentis]KAF7572233.1 hypothetical protein PtrM4_097330 [Pyrenophora tritici-repentis]KAI1543597.1 hypothetical protein PtrSN001C_003833 [Pyrenophora tritici-repentis]KAI1587596.1 hypothetical protein PtrEW7m1_000975 [Pyrenophora tritici-repentis]
MRSVIFTFLVALLATFAMAVAPQRSVIISWPKGTPNEIVQQGKDAIKKAGGVITHEYNIIQGFAATAPSTALEMVTALSDVYKCEIEEDGG